VSGRNGLLFADNASIVVRSLFFHAFPGAPFVTWLFLGVALATGPVLAADLPSKTEEPVFQPPPAPEFSWTGFYAGINVGGGIDHFAFPYAIATAPPAGGYLQARSGITASGPIGGIAAGYNYELPFFHIVAGFEIDTDASGIRGQTTVNGILSSGSPVTATFGSKFEDFGTARVRLGYAWGRFLPYLTAGFTYATTETYYSVWAPTLATAGSITESRTGVFPHVGSFGIGLEYALAPNVTVKAEYFYEFINARDVVVHPDPVSTVNFNTRTMYHVARVGVNYKFDWLSLPTAPVAAKY
jgi:outer membrane immunogenic protein